MCALLLQSAWFASSVSLDLCGRFVLIQQLSLIITFLKGFFLSCLLAWNRVSPRILELYVIHSVQQLHVELYNLKPLYFRKI